MEYRTKAHTPALDVNGLVLRMLLLILIGKGMLARDELEILIEDAHGVVDIMDLSAVAAENRPAMRQAIADALDGLQARVELMADGIEGRPVYHA